MTAELADLKAAPRALSPLVPVSQSAPSLAGAWDPAFQSTLWATRPRTSVPSMPDHLQLRPAMRPAIPPEIAVRPTGAGWTYAPGTLSQQHQQQYPLAPAATSGLGPSVANDYVSPLKAALHSAARVTGLPTASLLAEASVRTTSSAQEWRGNESAQDPLDAVFDRLRQSGVQLRSSIGTSARV
jgi:hypothetical protein